MKCYLAIDIGASSGRHIVGFFDGGQMQTREVYRFPNGVKMQEGHLVWDVEALFENVVIGIREAFSVFPDIESLSIDTWGVDYVLLDKDLNELLPVYCYRDNRNVCAAAEVEKIIPQEELYARTGIQKQNFNTIYQLYCDKQSGKLDKAEYMLMMPAYLSYRLTGEVKNEYTNATTSGMVNANTRTWDSTITNILKYPEKLFKELLTPADKVGNFSEEMKQFAGFDATVVFCPSHDTASAVAACPLEENGIYISSGTWSLIGIESKNPVLSDAAREANFANEGGIDYRFRFLKNYMGMWLLQNIRKNLDKKYTYDEMMEMAMECGKYHYIDVNAEEFVAPQNMIEAVRNYLKMPELPIAEVINSVYHSLARSYKVAVGEIETVTGIIAPTIHIVGGGCQDKYLNQLTAEYTGKKVYAGPIEATAIGNLLAQILYKNKEYNLEKIRDLIRISFKIEEVK